jgi:hypothetical protein
MVRRSMVTSETEANLAFLMREYGERRFKAHEPELAAAADVLTAILDEQGLYSPPWLS